MKYHDYLDLTMSWVMEALRNTPIPESPAPHLEPDDDEEAYVILWRELGKAKDATDD